MKNEEAKKETLKLERDPSWNKNPALGGASWRQGNINT